MTAPLTTGELRLLHQALELAAGYANNERDESAILELSARIRRAQKTIPAGTNAHTTILATIDAIKHAGRHEQLTPQLLDRVADELLQTIPL
jgi:hypothetical protein